MDGSPLLLRPAGAKGGPRARAVPSSAPATARRSGLRRDSRHALWSMRCRLTCAAHRRAARTRRPYWWLVPSDSRRRPGGIYGHLDDLPLRGSLVRPAGASVDTLADVLVLWEIVAEFAGAVARGERSWWPLLGGFWPLASSSRRCCFCSRRRRIA